MLVGTPLDPPEKLYDPIIEAFDNVIADMAAVEGLRIGRVCSLRAKNKSLNRLVESSIASKSLAPKSLDHALKKSLFGTIDSYVQKGDPACRTALLFDLNLV